MNIGVSFEIPQKITNTLWSFLNNIEIKDYNWYNVDNQSEIFNETQNFSFFNKNCYSGEDFFDHIQLNHYIIFLKLQAYLSSGKYENINSYDDFINSDCQMIILIYDCEYVEIYSKQEMETYAVYQAARNNKYKNISYITENNRERNIMNIR